MEKYKTIRVLTQAEGVVNKIHSLLMTTYGFGLPPTIPVNPGATKLDNRM